MAAKKQEAADANTTWQISESLERVWQEIKQISRQVEHETRRSGRAARLNLDIRKLRRDVVEVSARLGQAVYEAHREGGSKIKLEKVEGFAAGKAALDSLHEQIDAKRQELERLKATAGEDDAETSESSNDEDIAEEAAGA